MIFVLVEQNDFRVQYRQEVRVGITSRHHHYIVTVFLL